MPLRSSSSHALQRHGLFRQNIHHSLIAASAVIMLAVHAATPVSAADFPAEIDLPDLNGTDGFVLRGIDFGDRSTFSVSNAGDVNADGIDDLVIGDVFDNPNDDRSGLSYVVFGSNDLGNTGVVELSALDGRNGFLITGVDPGDESGRSVSDAGDVNGDGVDDLLIGAFFGNGDTGASYVIFGGSSVGLGGVLALSDLDGVNGYVINGVNTDDGAGRVSSAGDVNADGVDDLLIGAYTASPDGKNIAGASYVVFGGSAVGSAGVLELSDLNGANGFVLNGVDSVDFTGASLSGVGDVNADGVDDVLIGAPRSNKPGRSYVVFGGSSVGSTGVLELSDLDGSNGFVLQGVSNIDDASEVSGAGDVNDDGIDDLLVGASLGDPNGETNAGQSYVVFGRSGLGRTGQIRLSRLDGVDGFAINGVNAFDESGNSVSNAGDVNGDGVDDLLIGSVRFADSYVVFGGSGVGDSGVVELSDLDGFNGVVLNGAGFNGEAPLVSNAGDVNADGVGDMLIGGPNVGLSRQSYVVFGIATDQLVLCNGLPITVDLNLGQTPTNGDDVILGTPADDRINAMGGNDTVCAEGGNDIVNAGTGNDWVKGSSGDDLIRGGAGDDELFGESGDDTLLGLIGDDVIEGGGGVDSIDGGDGSDIIYTGSGATLGSGVVASGGKGADFIFGGPDADDIRGNSGADLIDAAAGNDRVRGGSGRDMINGGDGDDALFGGSGRDVIEGDSGRDRLSGGPDDDILRGGDGNDTLIGGDSSNDRCNGNAGFDQMSRSCEKSYFVETVNRFLDREENRQVLARLSNN